ncbi:MAG: acyltransferase [Lacinutrix sp.]|uniref:acyltransferase n=1 Tax=Lacinutrix sp. TaxID=1937692 RepID=UPI003096BD0D
MIKKIISRIYFGVLKMAYATKSNIKSVSGVFKSHQPVVLRGKGSLEFGDNVNLGVINSPFFYNAYAYIEARNESALIKFGNNININNSFSAVAEKSIAIEDNVLIGYNCSIIDSDFHGLHPLERNANKQNSASVLISKNVFIGNNVCILKGVTIGENTVVASNAVVTKSFPENVIIGGNPAKIIRDL